MIPALVLAAGASSRMGRPKAALPLGPGHTVLSRGVTSLLDAGVTRVVVVAGAHPLAVREALAHVTDTRVAVVDHPGWAAGQLSSLVRGLDEVDGPDVGGVLTTLVDVPLVSPDTVRTLLRAWQGSGAPIVRPARRGVHGHPVLFDRRVFAALRAADPAEGAKPVVRAHAGALLDVEVDDDGAFVDLDDPEDYARVLSML